MAPVVIWILVALLTAAVVLVVASVTGERSGGLQQFVADLRSGLRGTDGTREGLFAGARRELVEAADTEMTSVDELFVVGRPEESGYVDTTELSETLVRAKDRTVRGVTQLTRR